MATAKKGRVFLVGAGPGRADLITLRGAELLKRADCVIYDKLTNTRLLTLCRPEAELVYVPKRLGPASFTQGQINHLLVEKAYAGRTVVRLKGGDPCVFARCAEEAATLAEAGIEFEIVPGVTAGIAAGAYAGIMLTDRRHSSQVIFVTGREAEDKEKSGIDWYELARLRATIVFYMAMGNLGFIVSKLTENGMDGQTPAAVIANATLPTQQVVQASLGSIEKQCRQASLEPPVIVVIGPAARSDARLHWFANKPLFGRSIVVTRDRRGNADFAGRIIAEGGNAVEFPTIRFKSLTERNVFLQTLAKIQSFDWVVFTSANAVALFFDSLQRLGKDSRVFGSAKIAAVGRRTAARLREYGLSADFVPRVFTTEQLARQLMDYTDLRNRKILLLRSQVASQQLAEQFRHVGAIVSDVAVYKTVREKNDPAQLSERIEQGGIDWITFASPSAARFFFDIIDAAKVNRSSARVASIGPVTSEQLTQSGVDVDLTAQEHTIEGLLSDITGMYE